MNSGFASTAALFLFLAVLPSCERAASSIAIDGELEDWTGIAPLVVDPFENAPGAVDFGEVRAAHNGQSVYLYMDLGRHVNLQAMDGTVRLLVDSDGSEATGSQEARLRGVDFIVDFSVTREPGVRGEGVGVRRPHDTIYADANDLGLYYAPTYADRQFEVRLSRTAGLPQSFQGREFRGKLIYLTASGAVADETDVFTYRLGATSGGTLEVDPDTIARVPDTALRVIAWNAADRGLLESGDAFTRILTALDPDVVLLDELSPEINAETLQQMFGKLRGAWAVRVGRGGGRQRTAVASRLPMRNSQPLEFVAYPDSIQALARAPISAKMRADIETGPTDGIPTMGAVIDVAGRGVLLVPIDLLCCGYAGSAEDRARIIVAEALRNAIRSVIAEGGIDGLVIGGDFNLVGSRTPLDILARALDPAGDNLGLVDGRHLDGSTNVTWSSHGPFPPGRLDHVLYSPSSLVALRSFTFDTRELPESALATLALRAEDSSNASDHLPIVVDFRVR